jgi:hypothetical protein
LTVRSSALQVRRPAVRYSRGNCGQLSGFVCQITDLLISMSPVVPYQSYVFSSPSKAPELTCYRLDSAEELGERLSGCGAVEGVEYRIAAALGRLSFFLTSSASLTVRDSIWPPMPTSEISSQPIHWSKDFVEHLRTVHFTLIATAVALLIVTLTTKPYSTAGARSQLHKIEEFARKWHPEAVRSMDPRTVDFPVPPKGLNSTKDGKSLTFPAINITDGGAPRRYLRASYHELHMLEQTMRSTRWDHEHGEVILIDFSAGESVHGTSGDPFSPVPATIPEFQVWWDSLDRRDWCVYFPLQVWDEASVSDFPDPSYESTLTLGSDSADVAMLASASINKFKVRPSLEPDNSIAFDVVPIGSTLIAQDLNLSSNKQQSDMATLYVTKYLEVRIDRAKVAALMDVGSGSFNHVFYDLGSVAKATGIETLSTLDDSFKNSEPSEAPVFEAFGIKFPADFATLGGVVVLLCVQLYFFVYLRKLSGNLTTNDEGWNVPWLGMDSSWLARGILFATVVLLPYASLIVVDWETVPRLTRDYWDVVNGFVRVITWRWPFAVILKIGALLFATVISATLGILCWKFRPQMSARISSDFSEEDYQI